MARKIQGKSPNQQEVCPLAHLILGGEGGGGLLLVFASTRTRADLMNDSNLQIAQNSHLIMSRRRYSRITTLIIMQDGTFSEITIVKKRSRIQAEAWKGFSHVKHGLSYHLTRGIDSKLPFLEMHRYGPWDSTYANNIRNLGPILVALFLKGEERIIRSFRGRVFICNILNADQPPVSIKNQGA